MEKQHEQFVTTLYKFVFDLNRYHSTDGTTEFINNFKSLNMSKVMLRFYRITKDNIDSIKNKDDKLFDNTFLIFPDIDLKYYWTVLTEQQKKKIWIYLNILFTMSDMILYIQECKPDVVNKLNGQIVKKEKTPIKFDPYVGIGDDNEHYGVDDICAGDYDKNIEQQSSQPNIGSMIGMLGLGNMLNLEEIRNQLKHMSTEDIEKSTEKINDMLENKDPETTQLISSILKNINETLNEEQMGSANPLDDITKIAQTVTNKLKPEIEKGNFDMTKLLQSTQKLATKFNGKGMFPGGFNPFSMLTKFIGTNKGEVSEEEYMNQYMKVCNDMGIKEDDLSSVTPNTIQNIFTKLNNNNNNNNKK